MRKAFKFKAYPNKAQRLAMSGLLETHRRLYNRSLGQRKDVYVSEARTVSYGEQSAQLKTERQLNPYLALANFSSCQRTLKRLDRAFQAFFRRVKSGDKPGYPRFRGFGRFDSIEFTYGDGAKLTTDGRIRLQSVGNVKLKMHRAIEGTIKTVTFRKQADGWFVVFVCEVEAEPANPSGLPDVGIDLGLKAFIVTSDGETIHPPRFYRKAQKKLRRVQRSVARKKKGGSNRKKTVRNLARIHLHVANQRRDFHHKTALSLVRRYGLVAHETLNVRGIVRSLRLAKSTHDAGWSQFLSILSQKAECAAVRVVGVNPRHTSQICSQCGCFPTAPIGLSVRTYSCEHCDYTCDRDENAARNILKRCRAGTPPPEANAVGCDRRSPGSPRL